MSVTSKGLSATMEGQREDSYSGQSDRRLEHEPRFSIRTLRCTTIFLRCCKKENQHIGRGEDCRLKYPQSHEDPWVTLRADLVLPHRATGRINVFRDPCRLL